MELTATQHEELEQAVKLVMNLPYAQFLEPSRIENYFKGILQIEESPLWHAKRHEGIGASEIGFLVADYRNRHRKPEEEYYSAMKNARDVVNQKLMYAVPEEIGVQRRGKRVEALVLDILMEQLKERHGQVEIDHESMRKLSEITEPHSEHPWLVGRNVDLILIVDGKRVLVDAKAPSSAMLQTLIREDGTLSYQAQLHQYQMYAEDKGIQFDGKMIAAFNYDDASVKEIWVDHNNDLVTDIKKAGNFYWNDFVLLGRVPTIPTQFDTVYKPDALPKEFYEMAARMSAFRGMKDYAEEQMNACRDALTSVISKNAVATGTVYELGGMTVRSSPELLLNEPAILEAGELMGLSIDNFKGSLKRLHTAILKKLPDYPEIHRDNLAAVTYKASIRKVSDKSALAPLLEAVIKQSGNEVEQAAQKLTSEQMAVLDVIMDAALDEEEKRAFFKNLSDKQLPEYPPHHIELPSIISNITNYGGNQESKSPPSSLDGPVSFNGLNIEGLDAPKVSETQEKAASNTNDYDDFELDEEQIHRR